MKLTKEQLKEKADYVRKYMNEQDRKMVAPLFQMIKTLQDENERLMKFRQPEFISGFPKTENIRFPIYEFPPEPEDTVSFSDYLQELKRAGKKEQLEKIARVKNTTVEELIGGK